MKMKPYVFMYIHTKIAAIAINGVYIPTYMVVCMIETSKISDR